MVAFGIKRMIASLQPYCFGQVGQLDAWGAVVRCCLLAVCLIAKRSRPLSLVHLAELENIATS